ncbi:hypothetical protein SASPL_140096 [Salvia splendens]|uniref:Uncharacterized protein n=1 Tax=Salvia splendens TaxID=180675 RepID=A0A8X8WQ60_SALSN|nr:uncharacterized protein LOC121767511 [Salvia splendens]XP_042019729.1 uncharacterized protein LOC121767511 [Salvia splendens]KAG6398629.1 hypothetical protein SASPL_140096 [Salvia splendens]
MARKMLHSFLAKTKHLHARNNVIIATTRSNHHSGLEEDVPAREWCEAAFLKMKKWGQSLKELDLIGGSLVNINDHSRVFDAKLEKKMHTFKSIGRELILLPSMQETLRDNLRNSSVDQRCKELDYFCGPHEKEALTVSSLTKVADMLSISAQQRKVVRKNIGPQVTQHKIWTGALSQILNGLKSEVELLNLRGPTSKEIMLSQQILAGCLKILESAMSYDVESSSWMRLPPTKGANATDSPKWGDALEMCTDLVSCLCDESELAFHVSKLEVMKEGLFQLRDVLIDKNIGYKENRYQEHLVQKRLTKTLGHSSKCLFTLLMHYLYGTVVDVEMEVRGGVHVVGIGQKVCLYAGRILTVDEEEVVRSGVKQLDAVMGLFKFVWESAGAKGDLEVQGHLWCVGARNRSFTYRGNVFLVHAINL